MKLNPHTLFAQGKLAEALQKHPEHIDLNALDKTQRNTVLTEVIFSYNEALALQLVQAGIRVDIPYSPEFGHSVLTDAAIFSMYRLLRVLLEKGLEPNSQGPWRLNAIGYIVQDKTVPLSEVQYLLEHGVSPDCEDVANGYTPMIFAIENQRPDLVELLLKYGADPDFCSPEYLETPLMSAVFYDAPADVFVDLLLAYGARRDLKNTRGQTAYDIAIMRGHHEVAERLKP